MTKSELAKLCYEVTATAEHPSWNSATHTEKTAAHELVERFLADPDASFSDEKGKAYSVLVNELNGVDSNEEALVAKAIEKATGRANEKPKEKSEEKASKKSDKNSKKK